MFSTLGVLIIVFTILLLLGTPIYASLGLAASLAIMAAPRLSTSIIAQMAYAAVDSYTLITIPFFMLAGSLMELGGLSKRLVDFCNVLVGRRIGGFGTVSIICCMFFAAISGSGPATVAALGGILIPAMIGAGYSPGYAAALMAVSGGIGIVIPPSIPTIIYAVQSGASVGTMFQASFLPGILLGVFLIIFNREVCKRRGYVSDTRVYSLAEKRDLFLRALPALLMPFIILGGIYSGTFTPTEAAGVAVVYGFVVGAFLYREINFKTIPDIMCKAAIGAGTVMVIIMGAAIFSYIIQMENLPLKMANWVVEHANNKYLLLLLINIVLLIAGCFLDASSAIIILTPLLMPAVISVGINPVHFGVVVVFNLAIGLITPPVGLNLYVAASITKIPVSTVVKGLIGFMLVALAALAVVTYWPDISMIVPRLLGARGLG
jgi:C4-dicarboxylate transporter DctM subunit